MYGMEGAEKEEKMGEKDFELFQAPDESQKIAKSADKQRSERRLLRGDGEAGTWLGNRSGTRIGRL